MSAKTRKYVQGLLWSSSRRSPEADPRGGRPALEHMEPRLLLSASVFVYTADADFDQGALLNLNHDGPAGQMQINAIAEPFPYVNVACTGRGTLVRIDSETGAIVGEYAAVPDDILLAKNRPMRTAVDLLGNVWVANIAEETGGMGSVTRIALVIGGIPGNKNEDGSFTPDPSGEYLQGPFEYNTAIDRDGDGLIRTSSGLGNVLAWTNAGGADTYGGVSTAEDEAIINYTRTTAKQVGTLAIDASNDLWVGGMYDKIHEKISGVTGQPVSGSQIYPIAGGYGGLVDGNGVLWSVDMPSGSDNVLRYDTNTGTVQTINLGHMSCGVGIDNHGYVWVSNHSET
ncbi:MAG: LEPR-XLL domain-containing protein, partial [Phycisphaerae bacterium]